MATTKDRIIVSVSKDTKEALTYMAKRDQKPLATKAADLLEEALELEEDRALEGIIQGRLNGKKNIRWISHEKAWGLKKKHTR